MELTQTNFLKTGSSGFDDSHTREGDKQSLVWKINNDARFTELIKSRAISKAQSGKYLNSDDVYQAIVEEDLAHASDNKEDAYSVKS